MILNKKNKKNLARKKYRKGQVIFREGEFEIMMYAIDEGAVKIIKDFGKETERELTTLYEGDTFGEMGLIDSMPRSATAIAIETTLVTMIDNVGFGEYFKDKPAKVVRIMQSLSTRMRFLTNEYMDACRTIFECKSCIESGKEIDDDLREKVETYSKEYKNR